MGDAAPPMFDASAMPRIKALEKSESYGRLRNNGWMIEKQSTGAATLLIHMLATIATNMLVIRTVRGLVPALLKTKVAMSFAMLYFERAAAMVKPPRSSMITGVHMEAKIYFVAAGGSNR